MRGTAKTFVDARAIHEIQFRRLRYGFRRGGRDDAEFSLCARQRRFHIQPRLPAIFEFVERAYAGVLNAAGGGTFVGHGVILRCLRRIVALVGL